LRPSKENFNSPHNQCITPPCPSWLQHCFLAVWPNWRWRTRHQIVYLKINCLLSTIMSISISINKNEKFQQVQENQRPVLSFQKQKTGKLEVSKAPQNRNNGEWISRCIKLVYITISTIWRKQGDMDCSHLRRVPIGY
jgi:hypothetical protein